MTSLAQVTALVDAHVKRDQARFRAITLQIAAHVSARSERGADHLRKLVDNTQAMTLVPLPSANGLLSAPSELAALDDMVLAPQVRERLDRVVLEQSRKFELFTNGLQPARKLLFSGPPGTGKTMAAGALARAIGLPMFRVELHGVISSHLGETASKLAKVFEHVRSMPAVYLFDEFDAIGAERSSLGSEAAGTEMRRVVNSLPNHAQMLDSAIFRRFDETITFAPPSKEELTALVQRALADVAIDLDVVHAAMDSAKIGHADVCAALSRVRKDHLMDGTSIDTARLVGEIVRRSRAVSA